MPKKSGRTVGTKTVLVRVSAQQHEDLLTAAEGLGMDLTNLVRMIFTEHVPSYIERGLAARHRAEAARAKAKQAGSPATGARGSTNETDDLGTCGDRNLEL